jgi:hypothetical protein
MHVHEDGEQQDVVQHHWPEGPLISMFSHDIMSVLLVIYGLIRKPINFSFLFYLIINVCCLSYMVWSDIQSILCS